MEYTPAEYQRGRGEINSGNHGGYITLIVDALAEAAIGICWNMCGAKTLLGVAIMGTFILWAVRHPTDKSKKIIKQDAISNL